MFFSKVVVSLALVALAAAQHGHQASSYSSINSYSTHNAHDYHHAAPALIKAVAPVATYHAAPVVHAAPVAYHHAPAPVAYKAAPIVVKALHHEEEHYEPAKYQFKYGVHDTHTHDIKEQEESRDGDVVKGYYTLLQPDGVTRTVHYTADKHNGFQAQVEYSGHANHPEVEHKAVVAAPVYKAVAAPVYKSVAAPVYKTVAAPVYKTVAAPAYKTVAAPVYKTVAAPVYKTAPVYKVPAYPHF